MQKTLLTLFKRALLTTKFPWIYGVQSIVSIHVLWISSKKVKRIERNNHTARAPLKLLQFPELVIHEVLKSMNPHDLVMLSMCSTKARECYTNWKTKSLTLEVWLVGDSVQGHTYEVVMIPHNERDLFSFLVNHKDRVFDGSSQSVVLDDLKLDSGKKIWDHKKLLAHSWNSSCEESVKGLKQWTRYIVELFECPVESVFLQMSILPEGKLKEVLDWIETFQSTIQNFVMMDGIGQSEEEQLIFKQFWNRVRNNYSSIKLDNSKWMSLKNIIDCKSRILFLSDISISDEDVNILFKIWTWGGMPNCEYINLNRTDVNNKFEREVILQDIEVLQEIVATENIKLRVNAMKHRNAIVKSFSFALGLEIKRIDGAPALVSVGTANSNLPGVMLAMSPEIVSE